MTKIKLCGLRKIEDIEAANLLKPDYIGFVFAPKSKRYITPEDAAKLKAHLNENKILAVGVFVDEDVQKVAKLLNNGVIDIAQLHGDEDNEYIEKLRKLIINNPIEKSIDPVENSYNKISGRIIKAFKIKIKEDLDKAKNSTADYILLDAGAGEGMRFNWELLDGFDRPFFLAGGLDPQNVKDAIVKLHPYGVDVSSGIETDGFKDPVKMREFVYNARH